MQDHYPDEIRAALAAASRPEGRSGPGLRLRAGKAEFPVLRLWPGGLALPAEAAGKLRGRVDVHDGAQHLFHGLIVALHETGGEVICAVKQATPPGLTPPRDYAPESDAPESDAPVRDGDPALPTA